MEEDIHPLYLSHREEVTGTFLYIYDSESSVCVCKCDFIMYVPCLIGAISPLSAAAAAAAAAGRVALSGSGVSGVLLASNLNEEVH